MTDLADLISTNEAALDRLLDEPPSHARCRAGEPRGRQPGSVLGRTRVLRPGAGRQPRPVPRHLHPRTRPRHPRHPVPDPHAGAALHMTARLLRRAAPVVAAALVASGLAGCGVIGGGGDQYGVTAYFQRAVALYEQARSASSASRPATSTSRHRGRPRAGRDLHRLRHPGAQGRQGGADPAVADRRALRPALAGLDRGPAPAPGPARRRAGHRRR